MKEDKDREGQAKAFLNEASRLLISSADLFRQYKWKESVLASQQCMEDSVKALLLLLGVDPPHEHHFEPKCIEQALQKLPDDSRLGQNFLKVFLYANLWSWTYAICRYPFKYHRAGPELMGLIGKKDARLAEDHCHYCWSAVAEFSEFLERRKQEV